jgi:hypothetical protein
MERHLLARPMGPAKELGSMETNLNVAKPEPDKRDSDRVRAFLRAQIIFNNRMSTIDCIIKNISPTGARVALGDSFAVPSEFEIYIPQRNSSHHAKLVWRDKDSIGIDFVDAPHQAVASSSLDAAAPEPAVIGGEARIRQLEVQNAELKQRIRKLTARLEDLGQDTSNIV